MQQLMRRNIELAVAMPIVTESGESALSSKLRGYKHHTAEPHRYAESWLSG